MEPYSRENEEEINLYELWKVIVKRKILIALIFVAIFFSVTIASLLLPKIYRGEINLSIIDGGVSLNSEDKMINHAESAVEIIDVLGSVDDEKKLLILPKTYASVRTVKLKALKNVTNKIAVTIEAIRPEDIPLAAQELIGFLNNIDNVKVNVDDETEVLTQRSAGISELLKSVSDLTALYNKRLAEGKLLDMGFNPIDLSKKIADIKIEKLKVDQALARLKKGRIQIMTPPYISPKPVSPKTAMNIIMAAIIGLVMGIILAFFMEFLEKNKKN